MTSSKELLELAERIKSERIHVGRRSYRRFVLYPEPVTDGTPRCISCGQIDEEPYHDTALCLLTAASLRARAAQGNDHE